MSLVVLEMTAGGFSGGYASDAVVVECCLAGLTSADASTAVRDNDSYGPLLAKAPWQCAPVHNSLLLYMTYKQRCREECTALPGQ